MNSSSKPRERPIFFVDRSLGKEIVAEAIRAAGWTVKIHDDHFSQDAPDEMWLREAGQQGWVVLTKDKNIRFRELEKQALLASKVRAFVLTAHDISGPEMAGIFVIALPKMIKHLQNHGGPFLARVTRSGHISLLKIRTPRQNPKQ